MALFNIPKLNNNNNTKFAKVIKESPPVEGGMYKAVYNRFITLGFHENKYNDGKLQFLVGFGFELVEDMMGNKVPNHVKEFDDGTKEEGAKFVFRDYPIADDLHHKSNGFAIAKALDPAVPTIRRGRDKEHEYIVDFDWSATQGKTVLVMVSKKVSEKGNAYNSIQSVMPFGAPLEAQNPNVFFNLYDKTLQEVWDKDVYFFQKTKIKESKAVPGEPECIYKGAANEEAPKEDVTDEKPQDNIPAVDFNDDQPW